jgi:hypothetical protein
VAIEEQVQRLPIAMLRAGDELDGRRGRMAHTRSRAAGRRLAPRIRHAAHQTAGILPHGWGRSRFSTDVRRVSGPSFKEVDG